MPAWLVLLGALMALRAWGHVAGQVRRLELVTVDHAGHQLDLSAAPSFFAMRSAAEAEGVSLEVKSAWRSFEQQQELRLAYEAGQGNLAAEPGFSNHEAGRAIDFRTNGGTNAAFHWLTKNAGRYGWRRTVASEPWHWEYRP